MALVNGSDTSSSDASSSFASATSENGMDMSDNSNITSITTSSDQFVHCKLYQNITELKTALANATNIMQNATAKGTVRANDNAALTFLTDEQIEKSLKTLKKGPAENKVSLVDIFTNLYNAAKAICLPKYVPDTRPKANNSEVQLSVFIREVETQAQATHDKFVKIQDQLSTLTSSIAAFNKPPLAEQYPDDIPPPAAVSTHCFKHIRSEKSCDDFLNEAECKDIEEFLEKETFTRETGRGVLQYGEKYKYMGSNATVKPIPPILAKVMDEINASLTDNKYAVNSILVNKFEGVDSYLPEHADDEFSINPNSDIFTLSIGASRTIKFRDALHGAEEEYKTPPGSLYCMSRSSQGVFRHRIDKDSSFGGKVRYSITLRCIHYHFLNSTCVLGDSNTEGFKFGTERGTFGKSTPGERHKTLFIEDINPEQCIAHRNVVLMVGTNNLKSKDIKNTTDVRKLYNTYVQKIRDIRQLNKRCRVLVVPVIPSRFVNINYKIGDFNRMINALPHLFPNVSIVEGIGELADRSNGALATRFARQPDPSGLHVNGIGISILVRCIKVAIFKTKSRNQGQGKVVSNMRYAKVVDRGASPPASKG